MQPLPDGPVGTRSFRANKIPRYVRFTTEFPMTVTGKIQKFRMREISVENCASHAS
jgi:acyl-coenzyme A synthetase/AMP-(fatty) acid ligase